MMTIMEFLVYCAYLLIGAIAGVLAGLLGIGGGVVTVPCLFFLFAKIGFPQAYVMHMAIGTSLAAMILNTFSSMRSHHRRHAVLWPLIKKTVIGLFIGGLIGSWVASWIPDLFLEIVFGIFLCALGVFFFRPLKSSNKPHPLPKNPLLSLIFSAIGACSIILGLSGGIFTVPTLVAFKVPQKQAIGTASAIACLMTILGTIAFLVIGIGQTDIPYSIGYIHLPSFLLIGITSFFSAPLGAKWAHQLDDAILRKVFGGVLVLTGISMWM